MIRYGLTIENESIILDKAKLKKDGVYTFRGVGYRVKDGFITHFSSDGKILERAYGFNCVVGSYQGYNSIGMEKLKSIKS